MESNNVEFEYNGKGCKSYRTDGDLIYIELTKGHETVIDAVDFDVVSGFNWHYHMGYAAVGVRVDGKRQQLFMHQLLTDVGFCAGISGNRTVVDHVDLNRLNNQRDNFKVGRQRTNTNNKSSNTSGMVGVNYHKNNKRYRAELTKWFDGKQMKFTISNPSNSGKTFESALTALIHRDGLLVLEAKYDNGLIPEPTTSTEWHLLARNHQVSVDRLDELKSNASNRNI